ncbi:MAG: helix-turn-helix domain-containing protein [Alphaproteobacteria bacterium]
MASNEAEKSPNPVDLYVGGRIRMRRRSLGVSQEKLAEDLGLTFQQVQKYERGANRVSASKLYEIARSLQTPVAFFFEGLNDPTQDGAYDPPADIFVHEFLMTNEGLELAAVFPKVKKSRLRRRILDLVRAMAEEDEEIEAV